MKNKNGFTLVELLVVIVILAVLSVAAYTIVSPRVEESRKKSFLSEISETNKSAQRYFIDHSDSYTVSISELFEGGYLAKVGDISSYDGYITREGNVYYIFMSNGKYMTKRLLNITEVKESTIVPVDETEDFDAVKAAADMQIVAYEIVAYAKEHGIPYTYESGHPALQQIKEKTGIEVTRIDMINEGMSSFGWEFYSLYIKLANGYTSCNPKDVSRCCVSYRDVGKKKYAKKNPYRSDYNCHRTGTDGREYYNLLSKKAGFYQ